MSKPQKWHHILVQISIYPTHSSALAAITDTPPQHMARYTMLLENLGLIHSENILSKKYFRCTEKGKIKARGLSQLIDPSRLKHPESFKESQICGPVYNYDNLYYCAEKYA
jgi:hypothetical protein